MTSRLRRLAQAIVPGRHRRMTLVIAALAALFMLSGFGSSIMNAHDTFAKADRLAAISLILSGVPDNAVPVTLLDVDDVTRKAWGSRGTTPHAALTELVRMASAGGARGILVDFDLTLETPESPADPAMLAFLQNYPADAPILMLVRKIGFARTDGASGGSLMAASAAASPYDLAAAGKPNIMWVTTLNQIGADRSVRQIRLWQTVCDGASGMAYPSAALVTAGYLTPDMKHDEDLHIFLDWRVAVECGGKADAGPAWPPARDQAAYLPYVFGDDSASPALLKIRSGGRDTVALRRISASRLVKYADGHAVPAGEVDRDPFEGRIAVIGASYTESADVHETPLGTMPGSVILANSIVQAQTLVETVPPRPTLQNVFALCLFIAFAVYARCLVPIVALVSIGLTSVAVLVALSRSFGYESGLETVGVALTGFALFKLIDALGNIILDIPKRGWRTIFKT
ncbi:CHASE2 domain-containing protein [Aestuariivirga sp.]|uniref:CHASE2 domain-containing protein n=1 Tax=Aestuariivirga sp. TaxID=2650926 RepID=UPI0035934FBF